MRPIYLDYNATTPVSKSVLHAMNPVFLEHHGNPSSAHGPGRAAREAIEDARRQVAGLLACESDEILFTGCGTESNNLAIKGIMLQHAPEGTGHLVISAIEHAAVSMPAEFLERLGFEVTVVGCDEQGVVAPQDIESALQQNTRLVSVMHSNNEIGSIQPIREIAGICHDRGILVHTDASQSAGKVPLLIDLLDVDMLTLAGHKFYAPKGVGVLYVRSGLILEPLLHGAGHENGMRAGTENTAYITGIGQAAVDAAKSLDEHADRMSMLRDRLQDALVAGVRGLVVNAKKAKRLPNTLSVSFPKVAGYELLARCPEVCASTGPACHSGDFYMSPTLKAIGLDEQTAQGVVRLSVGWMTTEEEIDRAASLLIGAWEDLT